MQLDFAALLSIGALVALAVLGVAMIFFPVPAENRDMVSMIIGGILGALTTSRLLTPSPKP